VTLFRGLAKPRVRFGFVLVDPDAESPAGTPAPEPINVLIDSMIEGAPYEAEQERAIIAARWK